MDIVAGRVWSDERRPIRHADGFLIALVLAMVVVGLFLLYSATNQTLRQDRLDPFSRVNTAPYDREGNFGRRGRNC